MQRPQAIARAQKWAKAGVKYSQTGYKTGYRRDCSGLVSYAWDLPENVTTWRIPLIAKRISKNSLERGDVLLNASEGGVGGRHVVIFERWANRKKTAYIGIEQTGANNVRKAVRRKLPYPYKFDKNRYKPYRYVGMKQYYKKMPRSQWQPVKGYDGRVVTPQAEAAKKLAASRKAAEAKKIAKIEAARKAAEAEAAEKAALETAAAQAEAKTAAVAAGDAQRTRLDAALASPAAAVRYVATESAQLIVTALVAPLQSGPAAE